MRKKSIMNAKLILTVESDKKPRKIKTLQVFDSRTSSDWEAQRIKARGIEHFADIADLKQTANWNLSGDPDKYQLVWGQSGKTTTVGKAYIFD